jgi:protein-tyrosine phosphatase
VTRPERGPLPPGREPGRYRVELVCLGNICRSPTAHVVLEERLDEAGLADVVDVTSSGTGGWHVGDPMDRRAAATLTAAGYDASRHRAHQWAGPDGADLFLAMDGDNLADIGGPGERSRLFRDFDPRLSPDEEAADVPDPYYGGDDGFEEVLTMVERTASTLVEALRRERPWETAPAETSTS